LSGRARAVAFSAVAGACAIAAAGAASSYRASVDDRLGELRTVVAVARPLGAGAVLRGAVLRRSLTTRDVPVRFLPPDAIVDRSQVEGRRVAASVPAGSYLLASQLRVSTGRKERRPDLGSDLHPVEVTVSAAGSLVGSSPGRVDVVVAGEPVTGGRARVRVAARGVRLLDVTTADPAQSTEVGGDAWIATLALRKEQALELIEAENFAREIRLIPAA